MSLEMGNTSDIYLNKNPGENDKNTAMGDAEKYTFLELQKCRNNILAGFVNQIWLSS